MADESGILERLRVDQRAALKAGDKMRVATLRLLVAELTNRRIEIGQDLSDEDAIVIFSRAQKQRREAETQYRDAGRDDLADREATEAAIIREYLPEPIDDVELDALIDAVIAETGATDPSRMGAVIGRVMAQVRGRVEGSAVSARVKERLS